MSTDKKLLLRAAWITLMIALVGVGVLFAVLDITNSEQPEILDSNGFRLQKSDRYDVQFAGLILPALDSPSKSPTYTTLSKPFLEKRSQIMSGQGPDYAQISQDLEFIDEVFPLISSWKLENFQSYLAPLTLDKSNRDTEIREVMAVLSAQLGDLVSWEKPVLQDDGASIRDLPGPTSSTVQSPRLSQYQFIARYEHGLAGVNLVLEDQEGGETLYAFRIEVLKASQVPTLSMAGSRSGVRSRL